MSEVTLYCGTRTSAASVDWPISHQQLTPASERRENNLKGFNDFKLNAKALYHTIEEITFGLLILKRPHSSRQR